MGRKPDFGNDYREMRWRGWKGTVERLKGELKVPGDDESFLGEELALACGGAVTRVTSLHPAQPATLYGNLNCPRKTIIQTPEGLVDACAGVYEYLPKTTRRLLKAFVPDQAFGRGFGCLKPQFPPADMPCRPRPWQLQLDEARAGCVDMDH